MTGVSGKQLGVGLRFATVFALNASDYLAASGVSAYEGLQVSGAKAFMVNVPDPRQIVHTGDDRVLQRDVLPSLEGVTAELRAARRDFAMHALLTGTNVNTIGEAETVGMGTDQQGNEPQVGMLLYQQALDADSGKRRWKSYVIPKAVVIPKAAEMNENPQEHVYSVTPYVVSQHLWGTPFSSGSAGDGFSQAQVIEMMTEYEPVLVGFRSSGSAQAYSFPADKPAASVDKIHAFAGGVELTSEITKAVTGITTVGGTPVYGEVISVLYET
jgi:hypothetical protein